MIGPVVGALLVNAAKSYFTAIAPEIWLFILGGLFVLVTLLLPRGVVGTFDYGWNALKERRAARDAEMGEPAGSDGSVPEPAAAE